MLGNMKTGLERDIDMHTFMSAGNSSFFTRPVAATMFPIAPVVFSATACKHTHKIHKIHKCKIISVGSACAFKASHLQFPVLNEHSNSSYPSLLTLLLLFAERNAAVSSKKKEKKKS